jgi:hypothetical protein
MLAALYLTLTHPVSPRNLWDNHLAFKAILGPYGPPNLALIMDESHRYRASAVASEKTATESSHAGQDGRIQIDT